MHSGLECKQQRDWQGHPSSHLPVPEHSHPSHPLCQTLSSPAVYPFFHSQVTRGAGRKRNAKKCPLSSPQPSPSLLPSGSLDRAQVRRDTSSRRGKSRPGRPGRARSTILRMWCCRETCSPPATREEEGWSEQGATSNAPEYQGTAVKASSAPQRCPSRAHGPYT